MKNELLNFVSKAIQIPSYSDQEEKMAHFIYDEMVKLGYDDVMIDTTGNVIGKMGNGAKIIQFDSHMDTVEVNDGDLWQEPPFSGKIVNGVLWGRGSVDMKSALGASIYAVKLAKDKGYLKDKTVYVTATVCEEYCDGVNLQHLYQELNIRPDYCIICEPSNNIITLGHKGKAQIRITTHGVSAHGSAPEKGKNAIYEMAEIIERVEKLNNQLNQTGSQHGTIVLSNISSISASLNAVPSECSIYLDRRLALNESLKQVATEMEQLIAEKDASWEVGKLSHTSWKGEKLEYIPMHEPWIIEKDHPLTKALSKAYTNVYHHKPEKFDFWDFGTNAITPVSMNIPTIGFGPGDYKLAHMQNEHIEITQIEEACLVYSELIKEL